MITHIYPSQRTITYHSHAYHALIHPSEEENAMPFDAVILDLIKDLNVQAPSPDEAWEIRDRVKNRFDDHLPVNIQHNQVMVALGAVMRNTKAPKKSCKLARKLLSLLAKTYHEEFAKKLLEK
jgi:hypothetical protein